jgi:hypothetical protein
MPSACGLAIRPDLAALTRARRSLAERLRERSAAAAALGGRVAELGRAVAVRDRVVATVVGSIAGLAALCGR